MVFDGHAHAFPPLSLHSGIETEQEYLDVARRFMADHLSQPPRRRSDHAIADGRNKVLHLDARDRTGAPDRRFRLGSAGRFEWKEGSNWYYIQFLPTYMESLGCPPEQLWHSMEYAGVDKAVVVSADPPLYGLLDEYFSEEIVSHPVLRDSLLPLAHIDRTWLRDPALGERLNHVVGSLGLKGLFLGGDAGAFAEVCYTFWRMVRELAVPVYVSLYPEKGTWTDGLRAMRNWAAVFGDIPCVLTHAFPLSTRQLEDRLTVPDDVLPWLRDTQVHFEISYPVARGGIEDYPFPVTREAFRCLYETFGPNKLVWGSDYPIVERFCTYRQSLSYLRDYCDFVPSEDMERILGDNLACIFRLQPENKPRGSRSSAQNNSGMQQDDTFGGDHHENRLSTI